MPNPSILTEAHRPIIAALVQQGLTNRQIEDELSTHHGVNCSQRTITRARSNWDLQIGLDDETEELKNDLINFYHGQGFVAEHLISILEERHGFTISPRTLARRLNQLGLQRRKDDVDQGLITLEDVAEFIGHSKRRADGKRAGYRRIHHILRNQYHVSVHRKIVATMVKQMDADGVQARLRASIQRRTFYVPGPNHAWSADGHDKLKKFGITLYGFIDAWSRRVLGLFVHITNNNPAHIGLYFLDIVKQIGGIPQKTVTDHGTETINLAAHQIELSFQFANLTPEQAANRHTFTDSPHNQKVECLWSQLMTQHNVALIDMIFDSMETGQYNQDDPLQKLLFLYLWVPLVQDSLNKWMDDYNSYRKRRDKRTMLPTACAPNYCYYAPASANGVEGLIPVPPAHVDGLRAQYYPNEDQIMMTSALWLTEFVTAAQKSLHIDPAAINMDNVWTAFHQILSVMHAYDSSVLETPEGQPRAPTNHEQAVFAIKNRFGRVPL